MTVTFLRATKTQLKARLALAGPTGAGKTWSALDWASVLGQRIALIDTERGSAALYADHFEFDTFDMAPPYDPARCVEALRAAEGAGYDVVIVDSLSHFWQGEGGTLDIVDSASQRMGNNKYAGWSVGTPALRHLVDTMLGLDAHLVVTMRSKMDYVEVDKGGRKSYERVGMAPVMRDGIEYEFTLLGDMDLEHRIVISKSRCDLLADSVVQPGRARDAAETFKKWLDTGEPIAAHPIIEDLVARMNALPAEQRTVCKQEFVAAFGRPDHLHQSQIEDAETFVKLWEDKNSPPDGGSARDGDQPPRAAEGKDGEEEQSPSALPADSIEQGLVGPSGSATPAAVHDPEKGITDLDIIKLADRVFGDAKAAAPRGDKSKVVNRCRHALGWAVTAGRTSSLKDMTAAEKHRLFMELSWLADGFNAWALDADTLTLTHEGSDPVVIRFADSEPVAA